MTRRNWTVEEIEFIKENLGYMKVSTIAKKLERTEASVTVKMKRLGFSNTKSFCGQLTMHELATLLKVDGKSVKLWIENHGLPFTKRATRATKKFYFINPVDFWQWAYDNKDRIDFSKIERQCIIPEPDWVEQERLTQKEIIYKHWTTNEITVMLNLIKGGKTFRDIGENLNRSPISIRRKYQRLTEREKVAK